MHSVQKQLFAMAETAVAKGRPVWVKADHVPGDWIAVTSLSLSRGGSFIRMRRADDGQWLFCRFRDLAAVRIDEEDRRAAG